MLRDYELMLVLPAELDEETTRETIERVRGYITTRGGAIDAFEMWGRRRLSYPIKHHRDGVYHLARFSLGADQAPELDQTLQRNEQVLRHLMVRAD